MPKAAQVVTTNFKNLRNIDPKCKLSYINHFKGIFDSRANVIGMIAVSGDKVLGCDIFATNELFKSKFQSLCTLIPPMRFLLETLHSELPQIPTPAIFSEIILTEYQAQLLRERNEDNRKLAYKGVVVHYTNLQVQSDGKGADVS